MSNRSATSHTIESYVNTSRAIRIRRTHYTHASRDEPEPQSLLLARSCDSSMSAFALLIAWRSRPAQPDNSGWARERVRRFVGLSPTTKGSVCFKQRPNRPTRTIPGSLGKRPTTGESPNPHYTRVVGEPPNNVRIAQPALYPGRWGNAQQRPNRPTHTQPVCGALCELFAFGACPSSCSLQYLIRLVLSWLIFYGCEIHRVRGQGVNEWVCFLVLSCLAMCGAYKTKFISNLDLLFASTAIAVTRENSRSQC